MILTGHSRPLIVGSQTIWRLRWRLSAARRLCDCASQRIADGYWL